MRSFGLRRAEVALAVLVSATVAVGCSKKSPTPPTDFGVNLTIDAKALPTADLGDVKMGALTVTGAESQLQQFSVDPAITTGQLTFRYIPKVTSGALSFEFDATDLAGHVYGTGKGGPVTLKATAVSLTITLTASAGTKQSNGSKCTTGAECASTFCTDGTCCNSACDGICVSCALPNTVGICTPYPVNTDPEQECGGSNNAGGTTDAGATDAGSDAEVINPPDGGITAAPNKCGGLCNGMGACAAFADAGTSCGGTFCNSRKDVASLQCNGQGTCGIGLLDCTDGYACDSAAKPEAACHTSCNSNSDCLTAYYCNGTENKCELTKTDGLTCATDAECLHNHCVGAGTGVSGVCCNTACDSPFTCNDSGSAGTCRCPGVSCATGVSCAVFYPDADGDKFGDKTASVAAKTAIAACADSTQPGYVLDNTDCDDHDANVYPGQTAYFSTPSRGIGTFDYNCDSMTEKGIPEYAGATCTFCPSACGTNGCSAAVSTTCSSANESASLDCKSAGVYCSIETTFGASEVGALVSSPVGPITTLQPACCGCAAADHAGFTTTVNCGVSSNTFTTCGTCGSSSGTTIGSPGGTTTVVSSKIQTCH